MLEPRPSSQVRSTDRVIGLHAGHYKGLIARSSVVRDMSRQWTLPLQISEFKADDYGKLAHVFGSIFPDYDRTPEEWRFFVENLVNYTVNFKNYTIFSPEGQANT